MTSTYIANKRLRWASRLLPFVFMMHNAEELWAIATATRPCFGSTTVNADQFAIAVGLFTVLGFVLVFGKCFFKKNSTQYATMLLGFAGMLFLNVFFPHISGAVLLQSYTPGLISALILVLPLTAYILWIIYRQQIFTTKRFSLIVAGGALIGLVLVILFQWVGFVFTVLL